MPSNRGLANHLAVSPISESSELMTGFSATFESNDFITSSCRSRTAALPRDLEIQFLCDASAVPAQYIHVLADPLPRLRQVFVAEIDAPWRLERSGDFFSSDHAAGA